MKKTKLKMNNRTAKTSEGKTIVLPKENKLHLEVQQNNRHQVVQSKKTKHPRKQKNKGNKIDVRNW